MSSGAPLEGIRILDLTQTLSGPYGSMLLADLGAEVIKVESPSRPDRARDVGSCQVGSASSYFLSLNRNKRSVALDLKRETHREAFLRLVAVSDVVFENFRPGVAERLGLTDAALRERNPDVLVCSLSGFGHTGPERERPAYDYLIQALAGTMALTGDPNGPPTKYGISIVDHVGGVFAAMAIAVALLGRERLGVSGRIDVSLFDTHLSMLSYLASAYLNCGHLPERQPDSAHPYMVPSQLFPTADGYVVIMVFDDHFWPPLCDALERLDLAHDPRYATAAARREHRAQLTTLLSDLMRKQETAAWVEALQDRGVPVAPVQSLPQALDMEQVRARDMVVNLEHPAYGRHRVVGNPVKLSSMDREARRAAPLLGEHTAEVLEQLCEMSPQEAAAIAQSAGMNRTGAGHGE
jgi:crotonobetainyl-CoA:carnitine CoA-transferase CaiB-like acyl-CoA transferase